MKLMASWIEVELSSWCKYKKLQQELNEKLEYQALYDHWRIYSNRRFLFKTLNGSKAT